VCGAGARACVRALPYLNAGLVKVNINGTDSHYTITWQLDVGGFVNHGIIHKENPTRCNSVSKFYFIFM
jgi:hypothetical protein